MRGYLDEETKEVKPINQIKAEEIGLPDYEVEQGWNGKLYLKGYAPEKTVEQQNEEIRQQRQQRYTLESDPLRLDYDEALARGEDSAETLKNEWLASKDKIREELPYIEGENA